MTSPFLKIRLAVSSELHLVRSNRWPQFPSTVAQAALPRSGGILATGARPGAKFNYQDAPHEIRLKVAQIESICALYQVSLKAAALQFPVAHPAAAAVIPGCRSEAEVEENIKMIRFDIPPEFRQELRRKGLIPDAAPAPG
ncbi:MAG TPA: aldo/keto reductase [Terriglobia bacterium]|nr:aldo/keto reductase [Terriglobia bacterium]